MTFSYQESTAKQDEQINWITFEQLSDSLISKPKKVFIDFYADWCQQCKNMQKNVFTDTNVINELNNNYYSVKMNVETNDTIVFGDQIFVNERRDKRNPVHQIPLLMASRTDKPFSLPAMVIFDENFSPIARYFQFIDAEQLLLILKGESEE